MIGLIIRERYQDSIKKVKWSTLSHEYPEHKALFDALGDKRETMYHFISDISYTPAWVVHPIRSSDNIDEELYHQIGEFAKAFDFDSEPGISAFTPDEMSDFLHLMKTKLKITPCKCEACGKITFTSGHYEKIISSDLQSCIGCKQEKLPLYQRIYRRVCKDCLFDPLKGSCQGCGRWYCNKMNHSFKKFKVVENNDELIVLCEDCLDC